MLYYKIIFFPQYLVVYFTKVWYNFALNNGIYRRDVTSKTKRMVMLHIICYYSINFISNNKDTLSQPFLFAMENRHYLPLWKALNRSDINIKQ